MLPHILCYLARFYCKLSTFSNTFFKNTFLKIPIVMQKASFLYILVLKYRPFCLFMYLLELEGSDFNAKTLIWNLSRGDSRSTQLL